MSRDRHIEKQRYDNRAEAYLKENTVFAGYGSTGIREALASPYSFYEELVAREVKKTDKVLELGAGTGLHTATLLQTGAEITATDIAPNCLKLVSTNFPDYPNLRTKLADIESLPFPDASFDLVVCAGSLSYGDNDLVLKEVYRVLRPKGALIFVDSLGNNPIYRANRYIHYLKGNRSFSTTQRIPTVKLLEKYQEVFRYYNVRFFGAISWLAPVLSKFIGEKNTQKLSDRIDELFRVKKSAFKFVMHAKK